MQTIQNQGDARAILESIRVLEDYHFPRQELEELLAHPQESVPEMLAVLKQVQSDPQQAFVNGEFNMSFLYAYMLLGQLQEVQAFPIMLELLTLDSEQLDRLFADDLTMVCGRVLASTYDGDLDKLLGLLNNVNADPDTRVQAAIAMKILVLEGRLEREEALKMIEQNLLRLADDSCEDPERESVITGLVMVAEDLHPAEMIDTVWQMFDKQLVNLQITTWSHTEKALKADPAAHLKVVRERIYNQPIRDAISELSESALYDKPTPPKASSYFSAKPQPVVREPKIGRNDPCPCGGGKKYKKCCGA